MKDAPSQPLLNGHTADQEFRVRLLGKVAALNQMAAYLAREAGELQRELMQRYPQSEAAQALQEITPRPEDVRTIPPKSAAYECGASEDTIERRFRQGKAGEKINGRIYFSRSEIERMKRGEI